jgi:hypothetical protein
MMVIGVVAVFSARFLVVVGGGLGPGSFPLRCHRCSGIGTLIDHLKSMGRPYKSADTALCSRVKCRIGYWFFI